MSMSWRVEHGNCLEIMRGMDDASVDAICTDPPYGLGFMGKAWDHAVPGADFWSEMLRVAKPGAHLLAFGGTRLFHRMMVAIEDAGWEVRDTLMWVYGSGFPKSLDVSKAIDKSAGAEREVVGRRVRLGDRVDYPTNGQSMFVGSDTGQVTAPATDDARRWSGWGTALKPSWEPIVMARKPLAGTVAANVLAHGTGGINVDGCRVGDEIVASGNGVLGVSCYGTMNRNHETSGFRTGRWPANVLHDGSDEATAGMGEASRYFYCPKASRADRDGGCEGLEAKRGGALNMRTDGHSQANGMDTGPRHNHHPTVKPHALMRYLCRLVTPPGGTVLDPFAGSGSTGKAAIAEGFNFIGCELDADYVNIARQRIEHAQRGVA